jgi:hypothetical protein
MWLQNVTTLQALEFTDVASVEKGSGLLFLFSLGIKSDSWNFVEGCVHAYTPHTQVGSYMQHLACMLDSHDARLGLVCSCQLGPKTTLILVSLALSLGSIADVT